jgi:hypothetical protein
MKPRKEGKRTNGPEEKVVHLSVAFCGWFTWDIMLYKRDII